MLNFCFIKSFCILIVYCLTVNSVCNATIIELQSLKINFTNHKEASTQARWFPTDKLSINKNGLGWDGSSNALRDGWIQTKPLAVGLSWRPATSVALKVSIPPAPTEITLPNGQKTTPYAGAVFARYSPDSKNWSSWQELQTTPSTKDIAQKKTGRNFSGRLTVPKRQRSSYSPLLSKYSKQDVPWKSDEEAAVKWILDQQPDFFSENLPFIGYVEFLFEGRFYGNQRIQSFRADISYALSGLHSIPRDKEVYKNRSSTRWRLKAKEIEEAETKPNQK